MGSTQEADEITSDSRHRKHSSMRRHVQAILRRAWAAIIANGAAILTLAQGLVAAIALALAIAEVTR